MPQSHGCQIIMKSRPSTRQEGSRQWAELYKNAIAPRFVSERTEVEAWPTLSHARGQHGWTRGGTDTHCSRVHMWQKTCLLQINREKLMIWPERKPRKRAEFEKLIRTAPSEVGHYYLLFLAFAEHIPFLLFQVPLVSPAPSTCTDVFFVTPRSSASIMVRLSYYV